jgi:N-acetylglucosaminyl-diphospho-decaprenol L-rhamnosyltransferase
MEDCVVPLGMSDGRMDVVVVNYNTRDHLRSCLASLHGQSATVVVVDNGSTDRSQEMVRGEHPAVLLLDDGVNRGYGAAANAGIRVGSAPYVLVLNSDTIVPDGALASLCFYLDEHPDVGMLGPRLVNPDGTLQSSCFPFPTPFTSFLGESGLGFFIRFIPAVRQRYPRTWSHDRPRNVSWVLGAALAIRREAFDAVGGFDERYFMYFEEVDLAYRLQKSGWGVHFAPVTEVTHVGAASTRHVADRMRLEYYVSMARFYRQHHSSRRLAAMKTFVRCRALVDLLRFAILLPFVRQPAGRNALRGAIATQARLFRGGWAAAEP